MRIFQNSGRKLCYKLLAVITGCSSLMASLSGTITSAAGLPPNVVSKPVGFIRVSVPANKLALCSIPFALSDPSIQSILSGQLTAGTNAATADQILKWDPVSQQYRIIYRLAGSGNLALDGSWVESTTSGLMRSPAFILPGEGFWIKNQHSVTQSVFVAGEIIVSDSVSITASPHLNILGYPYDIRGRISAPITRKSGRRTISVGTWYNANNTSVDGYMNIGEALWYDNQSGTAITWKVSRPYPNPFPTATGVPNIARLRFSQDGQAVTVIMGTAGMPDNATVCVYYQDVALTGSFNSTNGWTLAQADIPVNSCSVLEWTDKGSSARPSIPSVRTRIYLVTRGQTSVTTLAPAYLGMSLPANFKPFSNSSLWNTPISATPEIDPDSALMIANLSATTPFFGADFVKWTTPVHVIDSTQARKVNVYSSKGPRSPDVDPNADGIIENIPMPAGIWPDPEQDGHMVMVDPVARKSWEFSRFGMDTNGNYIASTISIWDLNGVGCNTPFSGSYWWARGSNGAGVPWIGGIIRPEEIAAGEITHAILCATPVNRICTLNGQKEQVCIPACRTDGWGIGTAYIPEGSRLQLDPNLDLDALKLSPETKVVARAMQKYGMIVSDNSSSFKTYFQNLGTDWGAWANSPIPGELWKIPVTSFRVLKCNLVTRL
ncbi:MAG: hypothetical protein WCO42_01335 [bacterium]